MTQLSGRRVLVIGGSGYIGAEVIRALLREGAAIVNVDAKTSDVHSPENVKTILCDVADYASFEVAASEAVAALGGLDALIYAAGVMLADDGELGEVSETVWDQTFATNAKGAWIAATHALPWLRQGDRPSIVFVGSVASERGSTVSQLAYTTSKGAIAAMATELAVSLAQYGVRVNRVSPGPLDGGLLGSRLEDAAAQEIRTRAVPMRRLCTPRDVARACLFLIEADGDYVTGANLVVDGGLSAVLM